MSASNNLRVFRPHEDSPDPSRPRIREVVDRFWSHATANNRFVPRAAAERRVLFDEFVAVFGERFVDACKAFELEEWIDGHKGWKSSSTKRSKANWINSCFNWAVDKDLLAKNPFRTVGYEEEEPRPAVPDRDFWRIYKLTDIGFRRFLIFLRVSGCRAGEASALDWSMVNFEVGVAVIQKHKSKKKTRKPRVIVLTGSAIKFLRWLRARSSNLDGPIFLNQDGRRWTRSTLDTKWARLREKAKVSSEAVLHGIRHAFGTKHCKKKGANVKLVSLAMGHSSVAVTEKYYMHLDSEIEAIRRQLEE